MTNYRHNDPRWCSASGQKIALENFKQVPCPRCGRLVWPVNTKHLAQAPKHYVPEGKVDKDFDPTGKGFTE